MNAHNDTCEETVTVAGTQPLVAMTILPDDIHVEPSPTQTQSVLIGSQTTHIKSLPLNIVGKGPSRIRSRAHRAAGAAVASSADNKLGTSYSSESSLSSNQSSFQDLLLLESHISQMSGSPADESARRQHTLQSISGQFQDRHEKQRKKKSKPAQRAADVTSNETDPVSQSVQSCGMIDDVSVKEVARGAAPDTSPTRPRRADSDVASR